jgi:hypothetical protein
MSVLHCLMPDDPSLDMAPTVVRTLRLKVKSEAYPWLNAAAVEINQVWNYCNEISARAARPPARGRDQRTDGGGMNTGKSIE